MKLRQHRRARQALQERWIAFPAQSLSRLYRVRLCFVPDAPDFDEDNQRFDESPCQRCHGDGRDPWTDYLMPCPLCEGDDL